MAAPASQRVLLRYVATKVVVENNSNRLLVYWAIPGAGGPVPTDQAAIGVSVEEARLKSEAAAGGDIQLAEKTKLYDSEPSRFVSSKEWGGRRDLNPRPPESQSGALTN